MSDNQKIKEQTFAEKLRDHSELLEQTSARIQSLLARAKQTIEFGDDKNTDRIYAEAERINDNTNRALQEFEANHQSELEMLEHLTNRK